MSASSRRPRPPADASRPSASLDGIVACLDLLALEALELGNDAAAMLLAETAGKVRMLRDRVGMPRRLS